MSIDGINLIQILESKVTEFLPRKAMTKFLLTFKFAHYIYVQIKQFQNKMLLGF